MNKVAFSTSYSGNTPVYTADATTFISGATNNPTPTAASYVRWQRVGTFVCVEFKYIFATVPTTGAMSINLPVPINTNYVKPHSMFQMRYLTSGGVHIGWFNENSVSVVNLVASNTWGGTPASLTNLFPNAMAVNDIITGTIFYETG